MLRLWFSANVLLKTGRRESRLKDKYHVTKGLLGCWNLGRVEGCFCCILFWSPAHLRRMNRCIRRVSWCWATTSSSLFLKYFINDWNQLLRAAAATKDSGMVSSKGPLRSFLRKIQAPRSPVREEMWRSQARRTWEAACDSLGWFCWYACFCASWRKVWRCVFWRAFWFC